MFVTYAPDDGDKREWEFDPTQVRAAKAEMIEKRFNESWEQWIIALQTGSMKARRVLLWHLLSVEHPTLRYEDIPNFRAGELLVENSVAELHEIRERIAKAKLSDDDRETALAQLDLALSDAMAREEGWKDTYGQDVSEPREHEPAGKALSKNDDESTP